MCACVRACVRVCVRASVSVYLCVYAHMRTCVCVRVSVHVCLCLCLVFLYVQRYKCICMCIAQCNCYVVLIFVLLQVVLVDDKEMRIQYLTQENEDLKQQIKLFQVYKTCALECTNIFVLHRYRIVGFCRG